MAGLALAAAGGELFLRGVLAASRRLRLPAALAGATVAAFATSAPELGVSVLSALEGAPQLGLGNALGGNVVNLGLVLGIALSLGGALPAARGLADRRLALVLAAPVLAGALLLDGALSRLDALALLGAFFAWLAWELRAADRRAAPAREPGDGLRLAAGIAGLALLVAAGELIVLSAREMARLWEVDAYLVGAAVVALGTSAPELATAVAARLRGHHELGLGTLLGSNLFNGLFIVGTAALIHPIAIAPGDAAVPLAAAFLLALALVPGRAGVLGRGRGALLLAGYLVYASVLLRLPA